MCGIVGIINKNIVDEDSVIRMNNKIFHRGPDSCGYYFSENIGLAMRRLKIIDIDGGDQPIFNEDKNILIFFNGEIYNYKDLKKELVLKNHIFKSESDTEVLVHGYEEWGVEKLLNKIEGMFVFAIYDKKINEIIIARDRFGEKPLYYFKNEENFVFSSELKGLFELEFIKCKIKPVSLYYYLALHYVPGENTIIENIYRLEAGSMIRLNTKTLEHNIYIYWKLKERKIKDKFKVAKNKIRELLEKSIKEKMIADVPVGAFLSGGIDSSIIVGIMAKYTNNLKTFSIGFENPKFDESFFSKEVAKYNNTDHYHFIFTEKDVLNTLPEVVSSMDEPIGDQALLPVWLLSREAKKHVSVVLGGEGADEIFGGYEYYSNFISKNIFKYLTEKIFTKNNCFLNDNLSQTTSGFPLISDKIERLKLININDNTELREEVDSQKFFKNFSFIKNRMKRAQYSEIYSWLIDDLLVKYDRMAMASSLEGRAPYLDSRLVEYAFNLPNHYKLNAGVSKKILRESFCDLLPSKIFSRKKQGFNLPMSYWLRNILKEKLIESSNLTQDDFINVVYYKELINRHLSSKEDKGRLLYSIMVYRLWYKNLLNK